MLDKTTYEVETYNPEITPRHGGSVVFIASYITSKARLQLFQAIDVVRSIGGSVYYCDTDSIFTDVELPSSMTSESILGRWKKERNITRGVFWGSKTYIYESEGKVIKKLKGIPRDVMNKIDNEKIWNLDSNSLLVDIPTTWMRKWGFVLNKPMIKTIRSTFNRRIYDNIDNSSKPYKSLADL